MTQPTVDLEPVVSWPDRVAPGGRYLVTVDLRSGADPADWPYPHEEYPVGLMVTGPSGITVGTLGEASVVLHRFGGTYGAARFVVTVDPALTPGTVTHLQLTLLSAGGVPLHHTLLRATVTRDAPAGTPVLLPPDVPLPRAETPVRPKVSARIRATAGSAAVTVRDGSPVLALGGRDGFLSRWVPGTVDPDSAPAPARVRLGKGPVRVRAGTEPGSLLATSGRELFRLGSRDPDRPRRLLTHTDELPALGVLAAPGGDRVYVGTGQGGVLRVDPDRGVVEAESFSASRAAMSALCPVSVADRPALVVGDVRGVLLLVDAESLDVLVSWTGHSGPVTALVAVADGSGLVASAGQDHALRIWDVRTGRRVSEFVAHAGITAVTEVPRETADPWLVWGDETGSLHWYSGRGATTVMEQRGRGAVTALAPFPVAGRPGLAVVRNDGAIELHDPVSVSTVPSPPEPPVRQRVPELIRADGPLSSGLLQALDWIHARIPTADVVGLDPGQPVLSVRPGGDSPGVELIRNGVWTPWTAPQAQTEPGGAVLRHPDDPGPGLRVLAVRIRDEARTGLLFAVSADPVRPFGVPERELLAEAAAVLEEARLLSRPAEQDSLTGLRSRRAFLDELTQALTATGPGPTALLFLDLNGFKAVNDEFGHTTGDDLLQAVAGRLTGAKGARGPVGRLGGDEFAVVLRDTDRAGAQEEADRLSALLLEPFRLRTGKGRRRRRVVIRIGAAVGIAVTDPGDPADPAATAHELLREADLSMYARKRAAGTLEQRGGAAPATARGTASARYAVDLPSTEWIRLAVAGALFTGLGPGLAALCDHLGAGSGDGEYRFLPLPPDQVVFPGGHLDDAATAFGSMRERMLSAIDAMAGSADPGFVRSLRTGITAGEYADPFGPVFAGVERRMRALLGDGWEPPAWTVAQLSRPPRAGRDPFAVSAVTQALGDGGREVTLAVYVDRFGPPAFACVPALLLHECVCHVASPDDPAETGLSLFAEGLMSWVADHLLDAHASDLGSVGLAARRLRPQLQEALRYPSEPRRELWLSGQRAATVLVEHHEAAFGAGYGAAQTAVARLLVGIQLSRSPGAEKDRFASVVSYSVSDPLSSALTAYWRHAASAEEVLVSARPVLPGQPGRP